MPVSVIRRRAGRLSSSVVIPSPFPPLTRLIVAQSPGAGRSLK